MMPLMQRHGIHEKDGAETSLLVDASQASASAAHSRESAQERRGRRNHLALLLLVLLLLFADQVRVFI